MWPPGFLALLTTSSRGMYTPGLGHTAHGAVLTHQPLLLLKIGLCVYCRALENNSTPGPQDDSAFGIWWWRSGSWLGFLQQHLLVDLLETSLPSFRGERHMCRAMSLKDKPSHAPGSQAHFGKVPESWQLAVLILCPTLHK